MLAEEKGARRWMACSSPCAPPLPKLPSGWDRGAEERTQKAVSAFARSAPLGPSSYLATHLLPDILSGSPAFFPAHTGACVRAAGTAARSIPCTPPPSGAFVCA